MASLRKYILEKIKDDFSPYTITPKIMEEMEELYQNRKTSKYKYIASLMKVEIKDSKVYCELDNDILGRQANILAMIKRAVKNLKPELQSPKVLYIINSDGYAYSHPHLPFLTLVKPMNQNGILIPDNTFYSQEIGDKNYDWDETKKIVLNKCKSNTLGSKIPKLYFRGADTGAKKHNIRSNLLKFTKNVKEFKIEILNPFKGFKYMPLYTFCKYKYLLNLPGTQPWSYRFKYLFLMKSLVIDIQLQTFKNDKWINFFDLFLEEYRDYIPIKIESPEITNIMLKISQVYDHFEKSPEEYRKVVQNGFEKISKINNQMIDFAIVEIIKNF